MKQRIGGGHGRIRFAKKSKLGETGGDKRCGRNGISRNQYMREINFDNIIIDNVGFDIYYQVILCSSLRFHIGLSSKQLERRGGAVMCPVTLGTFLEKRTFALTALSGFESTLPSLACRAAIELDNLLLGRLSGFKAIPLLVANLRELETGAPSLLDPRTALIINRAISNVRMLDHPVVTATQLITQADEIRQRLEDITKAPIVGEKNTEEIAKLRSFCVELSKSAVAFYDFLDDIEPSHPFRR